MPKLNRRIQNQNTCEENRLLSLFLTARESLLFVAKKLSIRALTYTMEAPASKKVHTAIKYELEADGGQ